MKSYLMPILMTVGMALTVAISYNANSISMAEELGKRPTRQEMKETITRYQQHITRELDDVKKIQTEQRVDTKEIRRLIQELIRGTIERDRRTR